MYEMGRLVYELQKINCLNRTNKIATCAKTQMAIDEYKFIKFF